LDENELEEKAPGGAADDSANGPLASRETEKFIPCEIGFKFSIGNSFLRLILFVLEKELSLGKLTSVSFYSNWMAD